MSVGISQVVHQSVFDREACNHPPNHTLVCAAGTLPQALQGMQALGSLSLIGNGLNGTLPEQCVPSAHKSHTLVPLLSRAPGPSCIQFSASHKRLMFGHGGPRDRYFIFFLTEKPDSPDTFSYQFLWLTRACNRDIMLASLSITRHYLRSD